MRNLITIFFLFFINSVKSQIFFSGTASLIHEKEFAILVQGERQPDSTLPVYGYGISAFSNDRYEYCIKQFCISKDSLIPVSAAESEFTDCDSCHLFFFKTSQSLCTTIAADSMKYFNNNSQIVFQPERKIKAIEFTKRFNTNEIHNAKYNLHISISDTSVSIMNIKYKIVEYSFIRVTYEDNVRAYYATFLLEMNENTNRIINVTLSESGEVVYCK